MRDLAHSGAVAARCKADAQTAVPRVLSLAQARIGIGEGVSVAARAGASYQHFGRIADDFGGVGPEGRVRTLA